VFKPARGILKEYSAEASREKSAATAKAQTAKNRVVIHNLWKKWVPAMRYAYGHIS
jgi:hypothetical protein